VRQIVSLVSFLDVPWIGCGQFLIICRDRIQNICVNVPSYSVTVIETQAKELDVIRLRILKLRKGEEGGREGRSNIQ
jgi:hypothetical protein